MKEMNANATKGRLKRILALFMVAENGNRVIEKCG